MKYTTDIPTQDGYYWQKYDRFNGVKSLPHVSYRLKDDTIPPGYEGHGTWSFAGPLKYPKLSEFRTGVPEKPGCYLELVDDEDGPNGKMALPLIVLPKGSDELPEGSKYREMTYYGPFPEPDAD